MDEDQEDPTKPDVEAINILGLRGEQLHELARDLHALETGHRQWRRQRRVRQLRRVGRAVLSVVLVLLLCYLLLMLLWFVIIAK